MSSQDTTITHYAIVQRAKQDAQERMPDLPKEPTADAWEAFIDDLESVTLSRLPTSRQNGIGLFTTTAH